MTNLFKTFAKNESGAVTVDWVVLTAGIVGLGIGVIHSLMSSSENVASNISSQVADIEVIPD